MADREAFVEKLEAQLREWTKHLEELKARARKATAARRAEYSKQIAALQAHGDEATKRLHELRGAGEHAWEELREAAEKAWHEMSVAVDGAVTRLRAHSPSAEPAKVADVMTRDVGGCAPGDRLNAAAKILWERDCGCAPVLDAADRVVGILTDRDICMAAYFGNRPLTELGVDDVMTKDVVVCRPEDAVASAETRMREHQIRRLPVVDEQHRLVGILSLNDIARESARARAGKRAVKPDEVLQTLCAIGERNRAA
jgi:CBS domain-containing protein